MYEDVAGKKLLIIGSDSSNVHIIDLARSMGVYTIAVDWETDHSKCPAKLAADEAWDMSYRDIDAVAERCIAEHVDGVIAGYAEYRVLCAAKIAQKIGAPFYVTPEQMDLTRDKRSFKELCNRYGVPTPIEYCSSGTITEAEKERIRFPVIVKPSDYGGRIGITVCYCMEELDGAVEEALKHSENHTVVVEEYIKGMELSAVYTLVDGEISLSLLNDKYLSHEGRPYDTLCEVAITPSQVYDRYVQMVDPAVHDFLRGIGMRNGVAFFQLIANEEKITAFEMGLRLNGGNDWKAIREFNNINNCEMLIRHCLTGRMGGDISQDDPCFPALLCTYILYAHGGEVGRLDYCKAKELEGVVDFHPNVFLGKRIPDLGTTQQRVFSIKIKGDSLESIIGTIERIRDNVVVEDTEGKNMLFRPFDLNRLRAGRE